MQRIFTTIKETPTWLTVILGLALILWQFLFKTIPQNVQIVFFLSLILFTGIPHGALDHLIQQEADKQANRPYRLHVFLAKYLSIMAAYALLWYFWPGLSFFVFLIISAWHFAETDLEKIPSSKIVWTATRIIYGFYILAIIILTHVHEATPIIMKMLGEHAEIPQFWIFTIQNVKPILFLFGFLFCTFFIVSQSGYLVQFNKLRLFRLSIIIVLSIYLPLLPAFALYFGGWHALCAFDKIYGYLNKRKPALTFKVVYFKSLPFTILAIVFFAVFLGYYQYFGISFSPYAALFIFISLITLPHLLIAHQMNEEQA